MILLSLNDIFSAAQSSFAPNAFIMLLSISIASGPKRGLTRALPGKDLSPKVSTKRIHPILGGVNHRYCVMI